MKKLATLIALAPGAALAHPGHGADSPAHMFVQADHLVVIGAILVALYLAIDTRPLEAFRRFFSKE